jgi:hypothetical protein
LSIPAVAQVIKPPPGNPAPYAKYLFYLHSIAVELNGPDSWGDKFGKNYEYTKILEEFVSRGFNIVSEARSKGTRPLKYAIKTANEIVGLLGTGVPGKNIAVAGHSRGTFMSLITRSRVWVVTIAGCAQPGASSIAGTNPRGGYIKFLHNRASDLHRRFLSIYDSSDEWFGNCQEAFDLASNLDAKEIVVQPR